AQGEEDGIEQELADITREVDVPTQPRPAEVASDELLERPAAEHVVDQIAADRDRAAEALEFLGADLVLGEELAQEAEAPDGLEFLAVQEHRLAHADGELEVARQGA